ncbi:MAG: DUF3021 domain-containing protein [bacterium]|nr:DUF3021 domain-containing protein [bacterium]
MKKIFTGRMMIGLLGGIAMSYLITIFISLSAGDGILYPCVPSFAQRFGSELTAVIIQTILSAVLGAGFGAISLIWEKDEWSLLKQTSIYFAIASVLTMTVAYVCEWMDHSVQGVVSYFAIFFAIFIIVWIFQFIIWKRRISKINERVKKNPSE